MVTEQSQAAQSAHVDLSGILDFCLCLELHANADIQEQTLGSSSYQIWVWLSEQKWVCGLQPGQLGSVKTWILDFWPRHLQWVCVSQNSEGPGAAVQLGRVCGPERQGAVFCVGMPFLLKMCLPR